MRRIGLIVLALLTEAALAFGQPTQITVGDGGFEYLNLQEAFDDINEGGVTGEIELLIIDDCTQSGSAVLYPSDYMGKSDWTSITIYPTGEGYSIIGNVDGPMIDIRGATNVTIDGSIDGQGTSAELTIVNNNTGTSASTIRFIESAKTNIVRNCIIEGSGTGISSGIIFFSTASTGTGNDNNLISNNIITTGTGGRPVNGLFSLGTSGSDNSGNTINNNEFADLWNPGISSAGINVSDNSSSFIIQGNSFYESSSFTSTSSLSYYSIKISNTGVSYDISDNYIGGNTLMCGGTPFTKTGSTDNEFYGISISCGTGTASSIQNNLIANFEWSNLTNVNWTGINIAGGDVNVGTVTGNKIGEEVDPGSITVINQTTPATTNIGLYGINISGSGTVDCSNNTLCSLTTANNASYASNIYGINKTASAGTTTISNNLIGSLTTAPSIIASSVSSGASAQVVTGINSSGTGVITIADNTIANLSNATTNTGTTRRGFINGIYVADGTATISGNTVRDLLIANANNAANHQASVIGVVLTGTTYPKIVQGNTIYNLTNTNTSITTSQTGYSIIGIYFNGTSSSQNTISENFIHSFTAGTTSTKANFYGIKIFSGASLYANNIISLGGNTATQVTGIYETGTAGNNNNIYFNTVYIGGSPVSEARNSHAFYSAVISNTRDFRNNVFHNARSNNGATGSHYAIYVVTIGGSITCDYNAYYVSGTGGILGYYGGNKSALPVVTGQDVSSFASDPVITAPGSTDASQYTIGTDFIGVTGTGITTDFGSAIRNNPTPGAWERIVNKWRGTTSTSWHIASNWTGNSVPLENSNIIFDDAAVRDLYLNTNHSVRNITNSTSYKLVTNGYQLTIRGDITVPGGSQVNATAASSTIAYEGTAAQAISSADFVSAKAYNVVINNTAGVTLNSNFSVDNNLTISTGSLTISAPYLLTVSGTLLNSVGNSGLVLKSTANGVDAKLINNSASVPATVELSLSGGTGLYGPRFHYIVPPVQSMNIDNSSISATAASLGQN